MFGWLRTIFTWWNGATVGTYWFTRKRGVFIGKDEQGNRYYEEKKSVDPWIPKRRWVLYNGTVEASRIPADWHGWLHHTFEQPPTVEPFNLKSWEKPRKANLTGTPEAYRPAGSLWRDGDRAATSGDYEAWKPE